MFRRVKEGGWHSYVRFGDGNDFAPTAEEGDSSGFVPTAEEGDGSGFAPTAE